MATVTVTSSTGLLSALTTAHAGDTILLATGSYAAVNISNYHVAGTITIGSASSTSPAVIASLNILNSSGLRFTNVTFATTLTNSITNTSAPTFPFRVIGSSNIAFDHVNVHGTLDGNAQDDVSGFYINTSSNVSVTNSTFQQLFSAIADTFDTNVVISNNVIHDIRVDGIDTNGTSNVVISGNQFSNFFPIGDPSTGGDHPDAIQFFDTNTTVGASNITVENNSYVRGAGRAIQGVFITDQVGLTYSNVTVTGNTIIGGMGNGIAVAHANNVNISNNSVEGYSDVASSLVLDSNTNISLNNNIANQFSIKSTSFISQLGNQTAGVISTLTSALNPSSPVTVVAETAVVDEYRSTSGNALSGDLGTKLYIADVGFGSGYQKMLASTGATFKGTYGTLTIQPNGAYTYAETSNGLTVGQTYDDHFTLTIANGSGGLQTSTLDILTKVSGVGNGLADIIIGGAGDETISGFGAYSRITSGTGHDTYVFGSIASSTPTAQTLVQGFKTGDILDLSAVDPNFHVVTKFDHHANELMIMKVATGSWEIYGDTTGSGTANFQVHVMTAAGTNLSAANFHL